MKKVFEVEWPDRLGESWIDTLTLKSCINADPSIKLIVRDIDQSGRITEQDLFDHLMRQVKNAEDPDLCHDWACALDKFCNAIRTRNGG